MAKKHILTARWWEAAAVRALKTAAQTALSYLTIGAALQDIQWRILASASALAAIISLFTSLAGLPEVELEAAKNGDEESN